MHPYLIGPVRSYGFLLAVSFAVGIWLSVRRGRRHGLDADAMLDACFQVLVWSIVGVRLFYVLTHLSEFHPWYRALFIWEGGLTLYGGILLATAAVWRFARRRGLPFLALADVMAPQVALGIGITRIGCFLNGCCFGKVCSSGIGVRFPPGSAAGAVAHGQPLYPTQLFASAAGFAIFAVLLLWERRSAPLGATFGRFLLLYGVDRWIVDLYRWYEPGAFGPLGLTISQWISVALVAGGLAVLLGPARWAGRHAG